MKLRVYIFLFYLLLVSCNRKNNDILSSSQMQEVISDLMKADQFITEFRVPYDTAMDRDYESIRLYQKVFEIHSITKERFGKSLTYYQMHPELLKTIMDSISKQPIVSSAKVGSANDSLLKKDTTTRLKDSVLISKDSLLIQKKKKLLKKN